MAKIKYAEEYYDKIQERFPDLTRKEIQLIIQHGMRSFFTLTNNGADIRLSYNGSSIKKDSVIYFGKMFNDKKLRIRYFQIKSRIKLRIQYYFNKPVWDGYYYASLMEKEYQKYFGDKKKGRLKNKIRFENIFLYKLKEEAKTFFAGKYLLRFKMESEGKMIEVPEVLETRNVELIDTRNENWLWNG